MGEDVNNLSKRYDYSYDKLDRLTSGVATNGLYEQGIGYDKNGNIAGLSRNLPQSGINNATYGYHYENNGTSNRLQNVDGLTGTYGYDPNGNVSYDARNGVNIGYNFLNLPRSITGNQNLSYVYDATGRKLRKVSGNVTTDYVNGIQYTNGNMDFVQTEEGKAIKSGTNWNYEYTLTDHLGNNRLAFDTRNNTANKVQEDDYLPFGMKVTGSAVSSPENKYLYNKKELQDELGQYDYGVRFYDPVIARFTTVDPKSENHHDYTSYNYVLNNPLKYVDPLGLDTIAVNKVNFAKFDTKSDVIALNEVKITGLRNENSVNEGGGRIYGGDGSGSFMDNSMKVLDVLNQFNPIANAWDAATGYISGTDRLGNPQSALETTLKLASVIPIGKVGSLGANAIEGVTQHGLNQAITRGFTAPNILRIIREGTATSAVGRYGIQTRYVLGGNTAVLNAQGKIVTIFSSAENGIFIPFGH